MKIISELLLTFIFNACWQVALIAGAGLLGDRLLRRATVRHRHFIWVAALVMSLLLPLLTVLSFPASGSPAAAQQPELAVPLSIVSLPQSSAQIATTTAKSAFHLNQKVAAGLMIIYLLFLSFKALKLFRAWMTTRTMRRSARPLQLTEQVRTILANCREAVGVKTVSILCSSSLRVPVTMGIFRPLIIVPEALLGEQDTNALTAAIGHELVHISRRDYLLNLVYEVIFLPLSFHPAAALMKRRITQTRELRCDELVAERLLHPEVYARSLVQLAGASMPFLRRAQTITVGIADADILEVRIMSLLKRTRLNFRRNVFLLAIAVLMLAIPCVVGASYAFHLKVDPADAGVGAQEPSSVTQERKEARAKEERGVAERQEREDREIKERIEKETDPTVKAKLEDEFKARLAARAKGMYVVTAANGDQYTVMFDEARARQEREAEVRRNSELARMAKITMDQAIQIATSQTPGKVLQCSLVGERWEAPGKLGKDSQVLYHVVILSGDEANPITTHVIVNAIDGSIVTSDKEGIRERRNREEP